MKQAQAFLIDEGEAWLQRNKEKLPPKADPVLMAMKTHGIEPSRLLEIGCADGWRLKQIRTEYKCSAYGIDPRRPDDEWCHQGTADRLSYPDRIFDVVIYGFCLYLCDREDIFRIVTEGDRVLGDGGYLIIHDFQPEYPHKRVYHHRNNMYSYKMDYSALWLANPAYTFVYRTKWGSDNDDFESVTILKKDLTKGWPPYE